MAKEIPYQKIVDTVAKLCIDANCLMGEDVIDAFKYGLQKEESPTGVEILNQLIENAEVAKTEMIPACQDTGFAVVFLEVGSGVKIAGGELYDAINAGVAKAIKKAICASRSFLTRCAARIPATIRPRLFILKSFRVTI